MVDLFNVFAVVAHLSLLARDEYGEYLRSSYGGVDGEALKEIIKSYMLVWSSLSWMGRPWG